MENEDQKTVFEKHLDENATTLLSMTPAVATDLQMMCGPCAIYKPTKTYKNNSPPIKALNIAQTIMY